VRVKLSRILVVFVIMVLAGGFAAASDPRVVVELAVANQRPSVPAGANWGWWNPSKYPDSWDPDEGASFGVADARLLVSGGTYTVILAGEWYPSLDAVGTYDLDGDGVVADTLTLKTQIYDLGLGMRLGRDPRNGAMPWIGATYMDIGERVTSTPPPDSDLSESAKRADSGLWGVAAGVDGSVTVWSSLDVTGRVLVRWATGTRRATLSPEDPGGVGGEVTVSDSIDHFMWGLDIGLRWRATRTAQIEAGWRFRDRSLDDGPATFGGPQVKVAFEF
jgi:hypothetical protein